MTYRIGLATLFIVGMFTVSCSGQSSSNSNQASTTESPKPKPKLEPKPVVKAPVKLEPGDAGRGKLAFAACAACHGPEGGGDGAAAAAMKPKPRDLTDKGWQKNVTDEYLEKIILGGGMSVGKSPLMPANPGLRNDGQKLVDLVAYLRSLAQ